MDIRRRVKNLEYKYGTRNPVLLCRILKIKVLYLDIGDIKGLYKKVLTNKFIIINENLDEFCQRVVLAHELGHALLHHSKEIQTLKDYDLFPRINNRLELEANKFAAELIIDENIDDFVENPSLDIRLLEQLRELKNRK